MRLLTTFDSLPTMASGNRMSAESIAQTLMDMDSDDEDFDSSEAESASDSRSDNDSSSDSDTNELFDVFRSRGQGRGRGRTQSRGRGRSRCRGYGRGDIADQRPYAGQGRSRGHDNRSQGQHVTDAKWQATNNVPDVPNFIGEEVTNVPEELPETPKDYFELFIDDEFLDLITMETNRYADQFMASVNNDLSEHSRARKWIPTNRNEMKLFLALNMLMGINSLPDMKLYWSSREAVRTPIFSEFMSRDRFFLLLKFLHFNDNLMQPERNYPSYDRLFKLRKVVDMLQEKFIHMFTPGANISIDEGLHLWKGRLIFKQYIPNKPAKYGIKMYKLCDGSGYTWNFLVCTGSDKETPYLGPANQDPFEGQSTGRIVLYLLREGAQESLLNANRRLYMDRFYNGMKLFTHLFNNEVYCCGTLDTRRVGVPSDIRVENPEPGEMIVRQNDSLTIVKWRESKSKKPCVMLTTLHNGQLVETGKRKEKRDGSTVLVRKPSCVVDYNKHMGGVDKSDQMVNDYGNARKTLKWSNKLFFHLLDIACLNAFQLFLKRVQPDNRKRVTHLEFVLQVVEGVMEEYKASNPLPKPSGRWSHPTGKDAIRLEARFSEHWPKDLPKQNSAEGKPERKKTQICAQCRKDPNPYMQSKGIQEPPKRPESNICCPKCEVALHVTPCFKLWHTNK